MAIHFFTKGNINDATARFRGYFMADELNKLGEKAIVHAPLISRPSYVFPVSRFREFSKNFKILAALKNDDVLYLVRTIYQIDFLLLVVFFKIFFRKRFIFDFDDPKFFEFPVKMKIMTKLADAVVVGSHFLADWAKKYNDHVYIVPTSVPFDVYSSFGNQHEDSEGEINIGWLGIGPNHLKNLELILPVFSRLLKDGMYFRFTLIGSLGDKAVYELFEDLQSDGLQTEFVDNLKWAQAEEVPKNICKFDIGVMPLVDNEWNKGKCSFKAIEYMACGVPTVASDVGENKYLIINGKNGFLVNDTDMWYNALKDLILDANLRKEIGLAGQKVIEQKYSLSVNVKEVISIINKIRN